MLDSHPTWSPDGSKLAFVRDTGDETYDIYIVNADGSSPVNVSAHPAHDWGPIWSPDSRMIAFSTQRDGDSEVYVVNVDGGGLRNLTAHPSNDIVTGWSPGGT
jgi:TolB protein